MIDSLGDCERAMMMLVTVIVLMIVFEMLIMLMMVVMKSDHDDNAGYDYVDVFFAACSHPVKGTDLQPKGAYTGGTSPPIHPRRMAPQRDFAYATAQAPRATPQGAMYK